METSPIRMCMPIRPYKPMSIRPISGCSSPRLANELVAAGDTTRAIEALDRVVKEIPFSQIRHNFQTHYLIEASLQCRGL